MGGSNLLQASLNYLIYMCFIRISMAGLARSHWDNSNTLLPRLPPVQQ